VKISFGDRKLEKLANDYRKCQKGFGQLRAKIFNKRLLDLHNAQTLEDVRYLPDSSLNLRRNQYQLINPVNISGLK